MNLNFLGFFLAFFRVVSDENQFIIVIIKGKGESNYGNQADYRRKL